MQLIDRLSRAHPEYSNPWRNILRRIDHTAARIVESRYPPEMPGGKQLLNLGCGFTRFDGWVNADYHTIMDLVRYRRFRPDWFVDVTKQWKCRDDHWDGIFTEHVLEHLSYREAVICLRECHRTLKSDRWIRVCVPDLDKRIAYRSENLEFLSLPEAISDLTQHYNHRSVWNGDLMTALLEEIGFVSVCKVDFQAGTEQGLIKDQETRMKDGSLYVEARK